MGDELFMENIGHEKELRTSVYNEMLRILKCVILINSLFLLL